MEKEEYQVIIATPAKNRYHQQVLPYLHTNFSYKRAVEIDDEILITASTLCIFFPTKMNPERISENL